MSEPTPAQEVVILSSVCGQHYHDDCQSCQSAKASNDDRLRALERPSDEAVERSELLELLELGGDYAALVFNRCPDEGSELALWVKADIERFNKARAAIAAMPEKE